MKYLLVWDSKVEDLFFLRSSGILESVLLKNNLPLAEIS
jgi:hypothetical protein